MALVTLSLGACSLLTSVGSETHSALVANDIDEETNLLHCQMGHISGAQLHHLVLALLDLNQWLLKGQLDPFCNTCTLGKQAAQPVWHMDYSPEDPKHSKALLDLVHANLCGPLPPSLGEQHYFLRLIDCHSQYTHIYMLHTKDEAFESFQAFMSSLPAGHKLCALHTDNGGEFTG